MKDKLTFTSGILNIVVSVVSFINTVFMAICVLVAFALSFSLFFMAAIPLTLLFAAIFCVSVTANVVNMVSGIGSIVASIKGGKLSRVFCVASIIVDGLFIPANLAFIFIGALSVLSEVNWLGLLILLVAVTAIILAAVSFVLNVVSLVRSTRAAAAPAPGV